MLKSFWMYLIVSFTPLSALYWTHFNALTFFFISSYCFNSAHRQGVCQSITKVIFSHFNYALTGSSLSRAQADCRSAKLHLRLSNGDSCRPDRAIKWRIGYAVVVASRLAIYLISNGRSSGVCWQIKQKCLSSCLPKTLWLCLWQTDNKRYGLRLLVWAWRKHAHTYKRMSALQLMQFTRWPCVLVGCSS